MLKFIGGCAVVIMLLMVVMIGGCFYWGFSAFESIPAYSKRAVLYPAHKGLIDAVDAAIAGAKNMEAAEAALKALAWPADVRLVRIAVKDVESDTFSQHESLIFQTREWHVSSELTINGAGAATLEGKTGSCHAALIANSAKAKDGTAIAYKIYLQPAPEKH